MNLKFLVKASAGQRTDIQKNVVEPGITQFLAIKGHPLKLEHKKKKMKITQIIYYFGLASAMNIPHSKLAVMN